MNARRRILLAGLLIIAVLVFLVIRTSLAPGKLKLPVGPRAPAISLGFSHGLILASDGSLWTWGDQELGWPVLGLGKIKTQPCLRRIGSETNWVNVAAGEYHSLSVKADGTLWAWGANFKFQLGDGTRTNRDTPVPSLPGHDWKQVAVGGAPYSLALKRNGTLWAWGSNWAGQLGIDSTTDSKIAVQVGVGTNWVRVWAGGVQTVGLQSDGSLWFWGVLTQSPTTEKVLIPTRVSPDTNWADVCFGNDTVLAVKSDGSLWAWAGEAKHYSGQSDHLPLVSDFPSNLVCGD